MSTESLDTGGLGEFLRGQAGLTEAELRDYRGELMRLRLAFGDVVRCLPPPERVDTTTIYPAFNIGERPLPNAPLGTRAEMIAQPTVVRGGPRGKRITGYVVFFGPADPEQCERHTAAMEVGVGVPNTQAELGRRIVAFGEFIDVLYEISPYLPRDTSAEQ